MNKNTKLWGGRFRSGPSEELKHLSSSIHFDFRLAKYDLLASGFHAEALYKKGYLNKDEFNKIRSAILVLQKRLQNGDLQPSAADEDVHSALERLLIKEDEICAKLRAGRSRNDQIATFILLYIKENIDKVNILLKDLITALIGKAEEYLESPIAGRTHMQSAQPVLISHFLLAYAWVFYRDFKRLERLKMSINECPYGAGALAGSTLGLDSELIAKGLGFKRSFYNSMDAVSSRDIVAEMSFCFAMLAVNISRLSEDIIIYNTKEFGFIELDDAYSTGSSIMPQKKNPDIAELARGKSSRHIGHLTALLSTFKALPMSYNRDLQEDKEHIFDQSDQLFLVLPAFIGMINTLKFNTDKTYKSATEGYSLATDIAEFLVKKDVPFNKAHEITGMLVKFCEENKCDLDELSPEQYISIHPDLKGLNLSLKRAIELRATSLANIKQQISLLKKYIAK